MEMEMVPNSKKLVINNTSGDIASLSRSRQTEPRPVGKLGETEGTWYKPKKGSVFPMKRRLVKTMVFHSIFKFISPSVFSSSESDVPKPMISLSPPKIPEPHTQIYPYPIPSPDHVGEVAQN